MTRPLTKEERAEITRRVNLMRVLQGCANTGDLACYERLLSAEAFWRGVVKSLEMEKVVRGGEFDFMCCPSCGVCSDDGHVEIIHEAACPWLLAQGGA